MEAPYLHLRRDVRGQHKHNTPESKCTDLSSKVEVIYIQTKIKDYKQKCESSQIQCLFHVIT